MSVLLIVGLKCTPAASRAAPLVSHGEYMPTRQTDGRYTVTLLFPLDAASVKCVRTRLVKNVCFYVTAAL